MKILGIDSADTVSSVGICEDGKRLCGVTEISARSQSENLLPSVEKCLENAGLGFDGIDVYAVSVGPGSFTGVRIGVAVLKGLAFGKNKPVVAVSSLEGMAYSLKNTDFHGIICPVIDARHENLYNAVFRHDENGITRLCPDRVISADELKNELENYKEKIYFIGSGYDLMMKKCENGVNFNPLPGEYGCDFGYGVCLCAYEKYKNGEVTDDIELSPVYLRPSQAERMKKTT